MNRSSTGLRYASPTLAAGTARLETESIIILATPLSNHPGPLSPAKIPVKPSRRILVDVIQGCDKSAIEKSLLLVAAVCAVSVVVVDDCSHDERHADEAIADSVVISGFF